MTTTVKTGDTHDIKWGINADLTGKTVEVHARRAGTSTLITLASTVTDDEAGEVTHTLTGTLVKGTYFLEFQITDGGAITTAPSVGYEHLVVEAQIG